MEAIKLHNFRLSSSGDSARSNFHRFVNYNEQRDVSKTAVDGMGDRLSISGRNRDFSRLRHHHTGSITHMASYGIRDNSAGA
jgi:hypothetical protein